MSYKNVTAVFTEQRFKEIEFCCQQCGCSKNEFVKLIVEHWLDERFIANKLKLYENENKQQQQTTNNNESN